MNSKRTVVHMDLDSFFVSVECLRDSRLKGLPLLIGGSSDRSVVASCSYEARKYGIHSAMPVKLARRLCPDAVIIGGDMELYSRYSHTVSDIIKETAPLNEKASIDEFYLDISGMDRFFGCYQWTLELKQKILRETGLPISFGLSANKTVSKVGTGEAKPNGQIQIPAGTEKGFLAPLPVRKIPMIGEKTSKLLCSMGVQKIETLQQMPAQMMENVMGKNGLLIWKKANGIDNSPVEPYHERKSISTEHTFDSDSIDVRMMRDLLTAMAEKLAFKLREKQVLTSCIAVKIRYADFDTQSKQVKVPYTAADHHIIRTVHELFEKLYQRRLRIRLIGIRLSELVQGSHQISLFEDTTAIIQLYQAMDRMRSRFGPDAVRRAAGL